MIMVNDSRRNATQYAMPSERGKRYEDCVSLFTTVAFIVELFISAACTKSETQGKCPCVIRAHQSGRSKVIAKTGYVLKLYLVTWKFIY